MKLVGLISAWLVLAFLAGVSPARGEGAWTTYLDANEIRALADDGERLWVGTGGGIVSLDRAGGGAQIHHRRADGLLSDSVAALAVGPDRRIWIGTAQAGISVHDPRAGAWEAFTSLLRPIPGNRIQRVRWEGDSLLVATTQGFALFAAGAGSAESLRIVCLEGVDLCPLPSFDVRDLAPDPAGDALWLATRGGVVRLDRGGEATVYLQRVADPAASRLVRHRGEWIALFGSQVRALRPGGEGLEWQVCAPGFPADASEVSDLLGDGQGLLAATSRGVWIWDGSGEWSMLGDRSIPSRVLLRDRDGVLWTGCSDSGEQLNGLWRLESSGRWIQQRFPGPSARAHYRALAFDSAGRLHASTAQRGAVPLLQTFDGVEWTGEALDDWTFDLLFRPAGGLWLAQCCCKETRCNLQLIRDGEKLPQPPRNLRDLVYDDRGNLWGASDQAPDLEQYASGIWILPAGSSQWRSITVAEAPLMRSNRIRAVLPHRGDLWIGYSDQGLHRWNLGPDGLPLTGDDGTWAHFSTESAGRVIISDQITALAASGEVVWAGTAAGLSLIDPLRARPLNIGVGFDRLPTPQVNAVLPLPDGGAWVASFEGGVTRMTPEGTGFRFQRHSPPDLPHPNAEALALDPDGRSLWVGTSRGLARFVPATAAGDDGRRLIGYPNPFLPGCSAGLRLLGYFGSGDGTVIDLAGRVVHRFSDRPEGTIVWDGRDLGGGRAAPGLYWLRLSSPRGIETIGIAVADGPCPR